MATPQRDPSHWQAAASVALPSVRPQSCPGPCRQLQPVMVEVYLFASPGSLCRLAKLTGTGRPEASGKT